MPIRPGCYRLHLLLEREQVLRIGRLGTFTFPPGRYVYTGSALGGLDQRLKRYRSAPPARRRWHIDYLLPYATLERIEELEGRERRECQLNAEVAAIRGARIVARRFGSSDCRCEAHLVWLPAAQITEIPDNTIGR